MAADRSRQVLRAELIAAFSAREEVYRITIFGKEAIGKQDEYSDIDLIVYSQDPERTCRDYRQVFASVAALVGTFPLGSGSGWLAESLILRGFSPYHKVDFSIGTGGLDQASITELIVYDRPGDQNRPSSLLAVPEPPQDLAYQLANQLFAVPRFLKCVFRHDIDLYRRWYGNLSAVLVLWHEQKFGWQTESRKNRLLPYQIDQLVARLSQAEQAQLNAIYPLDGRLDAVASYRQGIDLYINLMREKAAALNTVLNEDLIAYLQTFLKHEYERVKQL